LGKGGRELVETLNVPVQKYLSVVRTIFWERPATHKIDLTEAAGHSLEKTLESERQLVKIVKK